MHILIIEDNKKISKLMKIFLEAKKCEIDTAFDGEKGLEKALKFTYDCIILDVMMPIKDGFQVLEELRKFKSTPVIMSTAKGEIEDKTIGYKNGVDDYITKPFDLEELYMRIGAVVRRSEIKDVFNWEDIEIHIDNNEVYKDGNLIKTTMTEFQILMMLIEASGKTVTREFMIDEIWGGDELFSSSKKLEVHICNIRNKLDKNIIQTVTGYGYKIEKK